MQQINRPQVALVELFDLETEEIALCDVTAHLQNALEAVYLHLADFARDVTPRVTIAADGELEGIAFLGPEEEHLAIITFYYLERDQPSFEFEGLVTLANGPWSELESGLTALFR